MKRLILTALVILTASLQAQETGDGAYYSSDAGVSNSWDKWIFASGTVAASIAGIVIACAHGLNTPNIADPIPQPVAPSH